MWALCLVVGLTACSLPSLPFGSTPTPHPIEVTIFATEPPPTPEPAVVVPEPTATVLVLPTTAPTVAPTLEPTATDGATSVPAEATLTPIPPTLTPTPTLTATATPTPMPSATTKVVIVTVVVTVVVTAPAVPGSEIASKLTVTSAPTASLRGTRTVTPTVSAKKTATPTRVRPTAVRAATRAAAAPSNLSNVIAVTYKSSIRSVPWGMPYNDDGCTQFDDRRAGRKVYLALIVHALSVDAGNWNAQFYQGANPFLGCISDPFIQHGTLRERDIPARGYPLGFDVSKTLIAFVPEGQSVTRLNLIVNGKAEICYALSGSEASEIPCG